MAFFKSVLFNKAAIDYAKEDNYREIVFLLSKGPIKRVKNESQIVKENESLALKVKQLEEEIIQLKQENLQKSDENNKLKEFLSALKDKTTEIQFFDFDDYIEESVIGEGATSRVRLVIKKEKYARKELKDSNFKTMQRFIGEGEKLFLLRHPCIIKIIAVNYGDDDHPPSLILSLEPDSLESAIENKKLDEMQKCRITVELVLGMRYIHSRNYMHRDLKPSNILLSKNNHVKISDFGLAKEESIETSQTKGIGSLRFMAPELFEESQNETAYTNKVDVYSFGITLIYIITDNYPAFSLKNINNGIIPPLPKTIVNWVHELIVSCLSPEPEKRPSFHEIFEIMKSNNYCLFCESDEQKLTSKQLSMMKEIENRVLKIEAFEFQHQND